MAVTLTILFLVVAPQTFVDGGIRPVLGMSEGCSTESKFASTYVYNDHDDLRVLMCLDFAHFSI